MTGQRLKILFIGDFSNFHGALVQPLRERGHEVTLVSDGGSYMRTHHDILLKRAPGITGTLSYLSRLARLFPKFKGYDIVQLINPHFLHLRPSKFRFFFDLLKRRNGSVFLSFAGDDHCFIKACVSPGTFRFSEYRIGDSPTPHALTSETVRVLTSPEETRAAGYIYENIDGAMSALPEYDMAARPLLGDRLAFTNIPIDLRQFKWSAPDPDEKVRLFIGLKKGKETQKGTAKLLDMARELQHLFPDTCIVESVTNLSLNEYLRRMQGSHIVLDQLYSYSPGMNAIQAMAYGAVAASGAQPEYYDYIGESSRPIIPLSPLDSDEDRLEMFSSLIHDRESILRLSKEGRALVERHNNIDLIVDRFESHWQKILS